MKSRHRFTADDETPVYLNLVRGTVLRHGDLVETEDQQRIRIVAKPEPVMTVTADSPFLLLKAAYHLGNRHVPLELKPDYLRLAPDAVLEAMLTPMGVTLTPEIAPFEPEAGAYQSSVPHRHAHAHS